MKQWISIKLCKFDLVFFGALMGNNGKRFEGEELRTMLHAETQTPSSVVLN